MKEELKAVLPNCDLGLINQVVTISIEFDP